MIPSPPRPALYPHPTLLRSRAGPLPSSKTVNALTPTSTPSPSADHRAPSHLAMLLTPTPPAVVKAPPAYRAGPLLSSKTASAYTDRPVPPPQPDEDQDWPYHFVMYMTPIAPAGVTPPPEYGG